MKPLTIEEVQKENADLRERLKRLQREWEEENRIIRLLIAADFVTEEKCAQARALTQSLR